MGKYWNPAKYLSFVITIWYFLCYIPCYLGSLLHRTPYSIEVVAQASAGISIRMVIVWTQLTTQLHLAWPFSIALVYSNYQIISAQSKGRLNSWPIKRDSQ